MLGRVLLVEEQTISFASNILFPSFGQHFFIIIDVNPIIGNGNGIAMISCDRLSNMIASAYLNLNSY